MKVNTADRAAAVRTSARQQDAATHARETGQQADRAPVAMALAADSGEMVDGAGGLPRKKGTPANSSNTPSSLLNTTAGRVNQPPTKAAGIESSRNGHSSGVEGRVPTVENRLASPAAASGPRA